MIKAQDAIEAARALIGTPYATLDCIGLIVRVIRTAPGGDPTYRCQGTNWLWRSVSNSPKYRDLTRQIVGVRDAQAGMLAFKRSGANVHHVGLVTGEGTVIHSSSARGQVVETALDVSWHLLGVHRMIETGGTTMEETLYTARVALADPGSTLNVRAEPGTGGQRIGRLSHGAQVRVVQEMDNGWARIAYGDSGVGYVDGGYLARMAEETSTSGAAGTTSSDGGTTSSGAAAPPSPEGKAGETTIVRADGVCVTLAGVWRVAED